METNQGFSQKDKETASSLLLLLAAGFFTAIVTHMPFGSLALYPFTILGTWFHEMGHGVTAILVGGTFNKLELYANGSGLAYSSCSNETQHAMIAAGGLIAPAIVGCALIMLGRSVASAKIGLGLLIVGIISSMVFVIRDVFGMCIMSVLAVIILFVTLKGSDTVRLFSVQFLGLQAWLSMYGSLDYLFTSGEVEVGGEKHLSDTGTIAQALPFLPAFAWGLLISLFALLLLGVCLNFTFNRK